MKKLNENEIKQVVGGKSPKQESHDKKQNERPGIRH